MKQQRTLLRLDCPHCKAYARVRYSEQITEIYREGVVECQNVDCGWRGKLAISYTFTMTPSLSPNSGVAIPLSPGVKREAIISQLQQ